MSGGTGAVSGRPSLPEASMNAPEPDSGVGTAIQQWPLVSTLEFGSLPTAVPCARLHTRNVLAEWQLAYLADDAETLVSELMTNALKASWELEDSKPIALRLLANHERLIIEVWDYSPNEPITRQVDDESEQGRGLTVIQAFSNRWGFRRVSFTVKVVWCELVLGRYLGDEG